MWFLVVAAGGAWIFHVLRTTGIALLDREQQVELVRSLSHGDLRHALAGTEHAQASPPGYGFFALPFDLVLSKTMGGGKAYVVAGISAIGALALAALYAVRGLGSDRWSAREAIAVVSIVAARPVLACLTESYHPSDLIAIACCLWALGALVRGRTLAASFVLGLGLLSKQWVIVPLAVMASLQRGRRQSTLVAGAGAVVAAGLAPFLVANLHATIVAISAPRIVPRPHTLPGHLPAMPEAVLSLLSRIAPLAIVAALCLWLRDRAREPDPRLIAAAIAAACLVRPLLDPAGFLYYLAPAAAFAPLADRRTSWHLACLAFGLLIGRFLPSQFAGTDVTKAAICSLLTALALAIMCWRVVSMTRQRVAPPG